MLNINGIELEVDFLDVEVMERYEQALEEIQNHERDIKGKKMSEVIRQQCQSVFDFFDNVFGEGTAEDVFSTGMNFLECFKALEAVIQYANGQLEEANKLGNKYSPNRAQRRSKK